MNKQPRKKYAPRAEPQRRNLKLSPKNPLARLAPKQLNQLEKWLFPQNLSFTEVRKRCLEAFKITVGHKAMFSFYRAMQQQRTLDRIVRETAGFEQAAESLNEIARKKCPATADKYYETLLRVVGQMAMNEALGEPDSAGHHVITNYVRLLSSNRREKQWDIRLAFEREKWRAALAVVSYKKAPEVNTIATDDGIPYKEKIRLIRLKLFGFTPEEKIEPPQLEAGDGSEPPG